MSEDCLLDERRTRASVSPRQSSNSLNFAAIRLVGTPVLAFRRVTLAHLTLLLHSWWLVSHDVQAPREIHIFFAGQFTGFLHHASVKFRRVTLPPTNGGESICNKSRTMRLLTCSPVLLNLSPAYLES